MVVNHSTGSTTKRSSQRELLNKASLKNKVVLEGKVDGQHVKTYFVRPKGIYRISSQKVGEEHQSHRQIDGGIHSESWKGSSVLPRIF